MEERTRKRVVILGGGFAGVYTARALEQALSRRDDFAITLINRENHFVFQPLLAEVVAGSSGLLDVASPLRRLLPRTDVYVRDIEAIDLRQRTITTSPGFRPHASVLPFDYLVLALGSVTDLRGLPEHALPFNPTATFVVDIIPTVSRGVTSAVVCTYGCDGGRIAPTRCAVIDAAL